MFLKTFIGLAGLFASVSAAGNECTGQPPFSSIDAATWVQASTPGWNLGNTLDAYPTEGSWNNKPVDFAVFDEIKKAGFKSIRIPVTWKNHFTSSSPSWNVDSTWMQRVSDVIDAALARDFYVIVNVHHDSRDWADVTKSGANYKTIEERFYRLWYQMGYKFACKSSKLAFEPINEPPGETAEHAAEINKLQELFIKALQDSGPNNTKRVVTLVGPKMDAVLTSQYLKVPAGTTNPVAVQFHYYDPYDFIFSAWGKTRWGLPEDKNKLDSDFSKVRAAFPNYPILVGEYDSSTINNEKAARWMWFDHLIRTANKYNMGTMVWDNGLDHFDRVSKQWRDPTVPALISSATAGVFNTLAKIRDPDPSIDTDAREMSSANLFSFSDNISGYALQFDLGGNELVSVTNEYGITLRRGSSSAPNPRSDDYWWNTYTEGSKTTGSLDLYPMMRYRGTPNGGATGLYRTLTVKFRTGAPLTVDIILYNTPVLGSTSFKASNLPSGKDLSIPITWKGLNKLAAVKAELSDGTFLVDPWTKWGGVLKQGRMTYANQYDWDANNVILKWATIQAVIAAQKTTKVTFEFFPREPGNNATITITP